MAEKAADRAARLVSLSPAATRCGTGLRQCIHRKAPPLQEVENFAKALCGDDDNPLLFEQALAIAQEEFVLRAITGQQLAVVERMREPSAIALAKGDNSLKLARAELVKPSGTTTSSWR